MTNLANQIIESASTGLISSAMASDEAYRPRLLYNDIHRGNTVLADIEREIQNCDSFWFSVAFITRSGLIMIKEILKELGEKGIHGRILTTDYLSFTEPEALRELLSFSNLEVRVFTEEHFHTKGYMFQKGERYNFIVGSSNMTQSALKANKEWNLRITSLEQGELLLQANAEFERMWSNSIVLSTDWIANTYEPTYRKNKTERRKQKIERIKTYTLKPNKMQEEATKVLTHLRETGKDKALLISATGTGKTYLSAFDVRNFKPDKMLFLVHREQILRQALESFKDVLGEQINAGILSGSQHDSNADYVFATVQTMCKEKTMQQFAADYFDYIIIDETHKAGAESYQRILDYFKPKFLLGMTASPERTDGYDIFQLFDHNIAYEIRLQQAMEEDLLCPFHYFGVTEIKINGEVISDMTEFRYLVSEERVENIIEKIEFYGYSGDRVKGLVFCSTNKEAETISELFNKRGYYTIALSGANSQKEREDAISRLEQTERENGLDYIFTVDIFNEGVDIPEVNQVIMLRPTQSSIIFVQQLGRGLRKSPNKEYVVVIDFIGNYQKNFLIPIALSGDRTYNKDTIRKYIAEGNRIIPGCSTIHFDEITKKRIYEAIDSANFNDIRLIKESYRSLKYKLGRIPTLMDFEEYGEIDVLRIFDNNSLGSYYKFLVKYEKEYLVRLSRQQEKCIEYISKKFASGKRVHELELIRRLLEYHSDERLMSYMKKLMCGKYEIPFSKKTETNLVNIMTNEFATGSGKATYSDCIFLEPKEGDYKISQSFEEMLADKNFYSMVKEIVEFGLYRNKKYYANHYKDTSFQLYSKYTYEDVCRLLEWERGEVALNIGGYKYDKKTKTYPVFINYDKDEDIQDTIRYEDKLVNPSTLAAISKSGRSLQSEDVYTAINADKLGVVMDLFVRKNKDDKISKEFYYLGRMHATGEAKEFVMPNTSKTAVEIIYKLETPVRDDLYDYITS